MTEPGPAILQSPSGTVVLIINPFENGQWPTVRAELVALTDGIEDIVANYDATEHLANKDPDV